MDVAKLDFIRLAVKAEAVRFGEFTLKSGRLSPYFFNAGLFNSGGSIKAVGDALSNRTHEIMRPENFDVFFGPAYKGIPLAVATSMQYFAIVGEEKGWVVNRKEAKGHGDKKGLVFGSELKDGTNVLMLDDVFTTGDTKMEAISLLKSIADVNIVGVLICLDRQEVNENGENAIQMFVDETGIPVYSLLTATELFVALYNVEIDGKVHVTHETIQKFLEYRAEYGVPDLSTGNGSATLGGFVVGNL